MSESSGVRTSKGTPNISGYFAAIVAGLRLATPAERRRILYLSLLGAPVAFFDTLGLGTVIPFVRLLVDPDGIQPDSIIGRLFAFMGADTLEKALLVSGLGGLGLMVFGVGLSFMLQLAMIRHASTCQRTLAREILGRLVNAPYVWFLSINTANVAHVLNRDIVVWGRELVLKVLLMGRDIAAIIVPVAALAFIMPAAGLIAIVFVGLCGALAISIVRKKIEATAKAKYEADERAHLFSVQALGGVKDVRMSGRESYFIDGFAKYFGNYVALHGRAFILYQVPTTAMLLIAQVAMLAISIILWWSGVARGELAAILAMLVLVVSRVVPAVTRLASSVSVLAGVLPSIRSMIEVVRAIDKLEANKPIVDGEQKVPRPWRSIKLRGVSFCYPERDVLAVDSVDAVFEAGRAYGIVGSSGSGKSTLADIVLGFLTPTSGTVLIDEVPMSLISVKEWQRRIGYVSQTPYIIDDTLRANVAFGNSLKDVDVNRLTHAINAAGLTDLVSALPKGLDTSLGERGLRLSGGQRQRIAIARALYNEVDLLVLDEATSALDSVTEREVASAIESLKGEVTLVTIAHRMSTVMRCDEILVMDHGRVVERGSHDELVRNSDRYSEFVRAQVLVTD